MATDDNDDDHGVEKPFKGLKNKGGENKGSDWRQMFLLFCEGLQNDNDDDHEVEKPFEGVKNKGGKNKVTCYGFFPLPPRKGGARAFNLF